MRATKSTSQNKYADSERDLLEAIKLLDPPPPSAEKTFGSLQSQLASLYERQQRYAEAEQHLLRSLDYRTRAGGPNDRDTLVVLANLCQTYMKLEKPAEAAAYGVRAISGFDEKQIEDSTLGHALLSVGRAEIKLGRLPDAEPHLVRALQVLDRVLAETDLQLISVRLELGALWVNQKRYEDAEALYKSGLVIEQKRSSADATWRATLLAALGSAYAAQGRLAEAELSLSEAIRIEEEAGPDREVILGQRLVALAAVLKQTNRYADTETVLLQARNVMDRALTTRCESKARLELPTIPCWEAGSSPRSSTSQRENWTTPQSTWIARRRSQQHYLPSISLRSTFSKARPIWRAPPQTLSMLNSMVAKRWS
jgi:tetratricopeptide (TPR) repeat protein